MTAVNFVGIPLFILWVGALIGVVVGVFARKVRVWRISLGVLVGVMILYLIFWLFL